MKLLRPTPASSRSESGAALLLSVLVLLVLVAIVFQLNITTGTDAQVARNDVGITLMDLSIESQLLEEFEQLKADAQSDSAAGDGASGDLAAAAAGAGGEEGEEGGEAAGPVDSREDGWARPRKATINEIQLSILIQDEESKYNILNMLHPEEELAEEAYRRVVKILDLCREDTSFDIDSQTAEDMARAMREHMLDREQSLIPRPRLLTDTEEDRRELGLPLSLREFVVLEPFEHHHFRDFYDEDRAVVHSIGTYLTVYSAPMTYQEWQATAQATGSGGAAPAETPASSASEDGEDADEEEEAGDTGETASGQAASGAATGASTGTAGLGYSVNINTAPAAVLKSLMDSRDVDMRFWDDVIQFRNLVDEEAEEEEENEFNEAAEYHGEDIEEPKQIFEDLAQLEEIDGYDRFLPEVQDKLNQLLTVQSNVFSIFITARRSTSGEALSGGLVGDTEEDERTSGRSLVRTVRCVVWRRTTGSEPTIVPIVRWEVIDYVPFELLDYPDERD